MITKANRRERCQLTKYPIRSTRMCRILCECSLSFRDVFVFFFSCFELLIRYLQRQMGKNDRGQWMEFGGIT